MLSSTCSSAALWSKSKQWLSKMAFNVPQFSVDARVFMVVSYLETLKVTETIRHFRLQFPHSRIPDRSTMRRNVAKYLRHDNILLEWENILNFLACIFVSIKP